MSTLHVTADKLLIGANKRNRKRVWLITNDLDKIN